MDAVPDDLTPKILVYHHDDSVMEFYEVVIGLYTFNTKVGNDCKYLFVSTVANNKSQFTH